MRLKFNLTCYACPEQYDVSDLDDFSKTVAYVRLRWSYLAVYVPDVGGKLIYDHDFGEGAKGCFSSGEEREEFLKKVSNAIANYYNSETYDFFINMDGY